MQKFVDPSMLPPLICHYCVFVLVVVGELSLIEKSSAYRQLNSNIVVIGTTSRELKSLVGPNQNLLLTGQFDDIAVQLSNLLGDEEPFLVLQRC